MRKQLLVLSLMLTSGFVLVGLIGSSFVSAAEDEPAETKAEASHEHGEKHADEPKGEADAGHGGDVHGAKSHGEDDSHEGESHSDSSHGDGHAEGVPLNFKTDLALWSLVTFLVFVFVLKTFAWTPLIDGLDKRESAVRSDIEEAKLARQKAEQMLAEHAAKLEKVQDEVREILAEARRDAEHTKNEIITAAQKESEATKNRALTEIQRAEDTAIKKIFDEMADAVADATSHVLGRALSDEDQGRLIDEALAEVGGSHN